jgi:hypothetical protein
VLSPSSIFDFPKKQTKCCILKKIHCYQKIKINKSSASYKNTASVHFLLKIFMPPTSVMYCNRTPKYQNMEVFNAVKSEGKQRQTAPRAGH